MRRTKQGSGRPDIAPISGTRASVRSSALPPRLAAWLGIGVVSLVLFALQDDVAWLAKYPKQYVVPLGLWIDAAMDWLVDNAR